MGQWSSGLQWTQSIELHHSSLQSQVHLGGSQKQVAIFWSIDFMLSNFASYFYNGQGRHQLSRMHYVFTDVMKNKQLALLVENPVYIVSLDVYGCVVKDIYEPKKNIDCSVSNCIHFNKIFFNTWQHWDCKNIKRYIYFKGGILMLRLNKHKKVYFQSTFHVILRNMLNVFVLLLD